MYCHGMTWLNYHHLLYFWAVAKEGTVTAACQRLRLAQPTVSTQLRVLEKTLGHKLFERHGRNLALTETGRVVYRYANEIFSLGQELVDTLEGRPTGGRIRLRVGIADVLSKQVAHFFLEPALNLPEPVHLICYEGTPAALLANLSVHQLDLVLSDSPIGPEVRLKAFNHLLGESAISIFAPRGVAAKYRRRFPQSLNEAPFLLPTDNTSMRRSLDQWFASNDIHPSVVAEFEDSALLKVFGQAGSGLFPAPAVIESETQRLYGVRAVGRVEGVRAQYFAISLERKLKHPGVVAIVETAHREIAA